MAISLWRFKNGFVFWMDICFTLSEKIISIAEQKIFVKYRMDFLLINWYFFC